MRLSRDLNAIVVELCSSVELPPPRHKTHGKLSWHRWLELIDEHQLGPYFATYAKRCPPGWFPEGIVEELAARYARSGLDGAFRCAELVRILGLLEGIAEPIVLKGGALAFTLYGDAAERPMSDIDLLFASAGELNAARDRLAREGYQSHEALGWGDADACGEPYAESYEESYAESYARGSGGPPVPAVEHHHAPPLTNPVAELTFELHLNLCSPRLSQRVLSYLWSRKQRLELGGRAFWVLDPVSRVIHQAIHATSDPIDSPLLRNLFEVAWLASKLTRPDRWALRTLASRWGIEARIAPALSLASYLFGSPSLLPLSKRGARELWCRSRLEWTDSFALEVGRWPALRRSLASEHLRAIKHGASNRSLLVLVAIVGRMLGRIAAGRVGRLFRRRSPAVAAAPIAMQRIGDRLLAHDGATGNVHLLDPLATQVLAAAIDEASPARIAALLQSAGVTARATRRVLDRLVEKGLVLRTGAPSRGGTPLPHRGRLLQPGEREPARRTHP